MYSLKTSAFSSLELIVVSVYPVPSRTGVPCLADWSRPWADVPPTVLFSPIAGLGGDVPDLSVESDPSVDLSTGAIFYPETKYHCYEKINENIVVNT